MIADDDQHLEQREALFVAGVCLGMSVRNEGVCRGRTSLARRSRHSKSTRSVSSKRLDT